MDGLLKEVRDEAWGGLIPAEFSMDASEVTSLQTPLPLYLLLPRMGYLPCVAEQVSRHFGEVAPDAQRTLWLKDARSGEPLRWHIPTGALFDLVVGGGDAAGTERAPPHFPTTARSEGSSAWGGTRSVLPWRITVHFQGCPHRQVFPLERESDIRRHYMNALKQALYLQLGSSRASMTLAKDKQTRLWHALKTNDSQAFSEMDGAFDGVKGAARLAPVRLLNGSAAPAQLPIPLERSNGMAFTLRDSLSWFCPEMDWHSARTDGPTVATSAESSSSHMQASEAIASTASATDDGTSVAGASAHDTVVATPEGAGIEGDGAKEEVPEDAWTNIDEFGEFIVDGPTLPSVLVQGIEVPLDAPIIELWAALRHPDHFLYIVLRKRRKRIAY